MASSSFITVCILLSVVGAFADDLTILQTSIGVSIDGKCPSGNGQPMSVMCTDACSCVGQNTGVCVGCCNIMVGLSACTTLANNAVMNGLLGSNIVCDAPTQMSNIKSTICECCYSDPTAIALCESVGVPRNQFWKEFGLTCGLHLFGFSG